ncbi:DUF6953 family protein [Paeniglutamicibacter cryotolerans]|uniref:Restriction system protein Mrr-like N-terminal domain-containing protein n=1 Tax=Paeniglutamicibacter cryotolerans TaxID=670079 RepID=A0A839QU87_9MICC|nr:hypothetical protein [Paeniglutamicibacter cryotolerans]MBB2995591.1 hypothetical protein [Paeniglutamicibacter cryotolerans]
MNNAPEIAQWILDLIHEEKTVSQESVVPRIAEAFGDEWVYTNENGHPAINREVLKAFRKLRDETVRWDREERCWTITYAK